MAPVRTMCTTAERASALKYTSSASISPYQNTPSPIRLMVRKNSRIHGWRPARLSLNASAASRTLTRSSGRLNRTLIVVSVAREIEQRAFELPDEPGPIQLFRRSAGVRAKVLGSSTVIRQPRGETHEFLLVPECGE